MVSDTANEDALFIRDLLVGFDRRVLRGYLTGHLAKRLRLVVTAQRTSSRRRGETDGFGGFLPEERTMVLAVNSDRLRAKGLWEPLHVATSYHAKDACAVSPHLVADLYVLLLRDVMENASLRVPQWVQTAIARRRAPNDGNTG